MVIQVMEIVLKNYMYFMTVFMSNISIYTCGGMGAKFKPEAIFI